jgi:alkylation response protein AidB-like acyl-CoA dehydrogenase
VSTDAVSPASAPKDHSVEREVRAAIVSFARRRIDAKSFDREGRLPRELITELGELGLFGLTLPESFGGSGLMLREVTPIVAEMASVDRSVATTVGLHLGLGTRGLVLHGTPEQKERYLPRLARGDLIAAFSVTEPTAGSDLSAIRAEGTPRGSHLSVTGSKCFVTNARLAGLFTVLVKTRGLSEGQNGTSLVLLEKGDRGFSIDQEERKLGLRASSTASLSFDEVLLTADRILGPTGQAARVLDPILAVGRMLLAAGCVGTAHRALAETRAHVATRRQFGRTLSQLPVVRSTYGRLASRLEAMQALVDTAAAHEADLERFSLLSMAAKVFASETAFHICDTALQLHGGWGYMEDSGLPMLLRDVRVTRIFVGANVVLLQRLGAAAILKPAALSAPDSEGPLAERLSALLASIRTQGGVALMGQPEVLQRIGRLSVLALASGALTRRSSASTTTEASLMSRCFNQLAATEFDQVIQSEEDDAVAGAAGASLLEGARDS